MPAPRLLIVPGSSRRGSYAQQLAAHAARRAPELGFASARVIDLRSLGLPVYDADLETEQGVPAGASTLQQAIREVDAVLICTPEYNAFPTPLFLNSFDWMSRLPENPMANKPTGLLGSSPGALGGVRALPLVRQFLATNFQALVQPQQFALSKADQAFAEDGSLSDAKTAKAVDGVIAALATLAARFMA